MYMYVANVKTSDTRNIRDDYIYIWQLKILLLSIFLAFHCNVTKGNLMIFYTLKCFVFPSVYCFDVVL